MKKPIIGIISSREFNKNNYFRRIQKFPSQYSKMIIKAGGIPIGILLPNGYFYEDALKLCDGFVFQGGMNIFPEQLKCMHYIVKNKKPALGVCLGMQTIAGYCWLDNLLNGIKSYNDITKNYKKGITFLSKVNNHNKIDPFDNRRINDAKHDIILDKDSRLYNIFKKNCISKVSVHNYKVQDTVLNNSKLFKIVGRSLDNVIEAIESKDNNYFFIGVQFHPELEEENIILFKELIKACKKP